MTWRGLVHYSVFFVMELRTRRVHIAGIQRDPDGHCLLQIARNLLNDFEGFLRGKTHLILDRDPLFTAAFKDLLGQGGIKVVTLPRRSPNLNGCAERFIRTLKEQLLWIQSFDDVEQLRQGLRAWARLYNETWLVQRHGHLTPAQANAHLRQAVSSAA